MGNSTILTFSASPVPEIIRYFRHGNYVLGEIRGQEEAVVLARMLRPRARSLKNMKLEKIVNLHKIH